MAPKSTSNYAAKLVVDHSREVVDKMVSDLEHLLDRHAAFDKWVDTHSYCVVSRKRKDRCHCPLCTGAKS